MLEHEDLSERIVGAAIEVHRALGPGLLESAYESCLGREFDLRGIAYERQKPIPVLYKDELVDCAYRADYMVGDSVLVELKSVEAFHPIHVAQLMTYMRLCAVKVGYLMNFNVRQMVQGIRRIVV